MTERRLRSARPHQGLQPASAESLIGRAADLASIEAKFEAGARLVTITGVGGAGKTRVAAAFREKHDQAYRAHGG
ncbi:MAG: hypothetical protein JNK04_00570, partial [Myxococcales bacterium]|nr:hypothetical protein [Myxococcales bacterium]